ncbi:MAG: GGDEF domain-containing phosphodiesterase, partial [Bacilli bacterium]
NFLGYTDGTMLCMLKPERAVYSNSSSGVSGVCFENRRKKWRAQIGLKGKNHFLGYFDKKEDAIQARIEAEVKYWNPLLEKRESIEEKKTVSFFYREATHIEKLHATVLVNRVDNLGNPEEVVSYIDDQKESDEDTEEIKLRYEALTAIINRDNLAEFYLEFPTDKVTVFKVPSYWENTQWIKKDSFTEAFSLFVKDLVLPEDQGRIRKLFENENLRRTLMDQGHYSTMEFQGVLNGRERWLRLEAVPGTNGEHNILSNAILILNDVTEEILHRNDLLTGLLGREKMLLLIQQKDEDIKEKGEEQNWSIFYVNLTHFKLFNRTFGKNNGDCYLKRVADNLSQTFSDCDVSRFGDDHFVILGNLTPEEGEKRILSVEDTLRKENGNYTLELHAGIYRLSKEETLSPLAMCDAAKMACDQIHHSLNDHVYLYSEELAHQEIVSRYLLDHIDEAIEEGEIQVYYQPIIRSLSGKVTSLEALARWNSRKYGFLSPGIFIPLLEEHSLCWKIDSFIIEKSASYMEERKKNGEPLIPISVNISRTDLAVKDFPSFLEETVAKHHLTKDLFAVEITESATVRDPSLLKNSIDSFHQKGFEVWMDDFGSGYSSLNALHGYHFDVIKLDLFFLRNFEESSKVILSSCVDMAKKLHIHTLAEGAETIDQIDFLKSIGVEQIQGYYYSKPIPYPELQEKLHAQTFVLENEKEREGMEKIGSINALTTTPLILFTSEQGRIHVFFENESFQGLFLNGDKDHSHNQEELLEKSDFASLSSQDKGYDKTFVFQGKEVNASLMEIVPYNEGSLGVLSFSLSDRKEG